MKKSMVIAVVLGLAIGFAAHVSNICTYYSMPVGETPNGIRIEERVEAPDGVIRTCTATPWFNNPILGVDISYR